LALDSDGKFTLTQVPTGEYDLVAVYNRYLSKLLQIDTYPGVDTLFVNFGTLLGGDCVGYVDSLGDAYPDNQIVTADLTRMSSAFLDTPDSSRWDTDIDSSTGGKYNYKWCDVNEDGIVEEDDLDMATANINSTGAQPYYKGVVTPSNMSNLEAGIEFMNIPDRLSVGKTFTLQVVGTDMANLRTYFVNLEYDSEKLTFQGISKGDIFLSDSFSFPVINGDTVGYVNSLYGKTAFTGEGVLTQVTFTANFNGVLTADMLGIERVSLVNGAFVKENLVIEDSAGLPINDIPAVFSLGQNFPNPFNPTTTINFGLPEDSKVTLKIFDILGRHVDTLVNGAYAPGNYSVVWDATDKYGRAVSAGVYFYTINAGTFHTTQKMLLIK
jgi:hypothetical protein